MSLRSILAVLFAVVLLAAGALVACSGERPEAAAGELPGLAGSGGASCATPNLGCECPSEGESVACGKVKTQIGSFVECSMGHRTCLGGKWGDCEGDLIVTKTVADLHPAALADGGTSCSGSGSACDPYCSQMTDTPDNSLITADGGLALLDGGLALSGGAAVGVSCTSVTIAPTNGAITITSFSPFTTSPASLTLTATFAPAGCVPPGTQPTWTVDRADLATISASGQLTVFGGQAGLDLIKVQAFFGSLVSNVAPVDVFVKTADATSVSPNTAAPPGQVDKFFTDGTRTVVAVGVGASDVTWLYPYADTYFPLGLPAPVIMYKMGANPGNTVKVILRYPSGSTATTSTFEGAFFVKEGACSDTTQCYSQNANKDVQIVVNPALWRAFEQTAKGAFADIVVQRWAASTLQVESPRRIHLDTGQLKGTVWYTSYSSGLVGYTGAVLKITPGATAPAVGIQIGGKCTACHTMNQDGSRTIANGYRYPSGGGFLDSQLFDTGSAPSGTPLLTTVLRQYNNGAGTPNPGIRFNYAAPRTDGTVYLTHGGGTGGDANWRAPASASAFWNPQTMTSIPVTGFTNIQAVTPKFSVAGDKIAFGYWSAGTALSKLPSGTLAADSTGKSIAVVDFSCSGSPCTSGAVSNARNVTPGSANMVGWPTFSPDGSSVIYQRQIVSSTGNLGGAWSPSKINSVAGAQADLWITNVTANSSVASTPAQLKAANGLTAAGATYLPQTARDVNPAITSTNYHTDGVSFGIKQADNCSNTGTATSVSDTRLNYLPSFMPVAAGDKYWVVFTSRRMYGSIAYDNPWDPEPNQSCSSGTPQTKKLWVAAIDKTYTPGVDPSHPAFYLPGQELAAGNSTAYWVNQPCGAVGSSCSIDADCCQTPSATQCRIDLPATNPVTRSCRAASSCVGAGATCTQDSDCCGNPVLKCLGSGSKVCASLGGYTSTTFTRDFTAACTTGFKVVWQSFTWQATATAAASIDFTAQTGATFGALGAAVAIGTANTTVVAPSWATSPTTVDQALQAATPAQQSKAVLRVSMKFNTNGNVTPILYAWRQFYDCIPNE